MLCEENKIKLTFFILISSSFPFTYYICWIICNWLFFTNNKVLTLRMYCFWEDHFDFDSSENSSEIPCKPLEFVIYFHFGISNLYLYLLFYYCILDNNAFFFYLIPLFLSQTMDYWVCIWKSWTQSVHMAFWNTFLHSMLSRMHMWLQRITFKRNMNCILNEGEVL